MKIGQWRQQLIVYILPFEYHPKHSYTHAQINPRTRINVKRTLPNGILLTPIERLNGNILLWATFVQHVHCTVSSYIPKSAMILIQFESWVRKWLSTPTKNCSENALVNDNQSIEPIYSCNWIEFFQQEVGRRHGGISIWGSCFGQKSVGNGGTYKMGWYDGQWKWNTKLNWTESDRVKANVSNVNANMKLKYR